MARVLVVHASRHGATRGIAERIAQVIRDEGHEVDLAPAAAHPSVGGHDAVVMGSGVYMGSWLDDGIDFLRANRGLLSARHVWLFSSGPLLGSSKEDRSKDPIENALGPVEGPGSGGRRKLQELVDEINPRDHQVFAGAYDPSDPPKNLAERFVRLMPAAKNVLPTGDFRDWPAIEAWAREIAGQLPAQVPAGAPAG